MRLFVAVNFDKEITDHLYGCAQLLRENCLNVNVSHKENLHLTLAFIGEVPSAKKAIDALQAVESKPFAVTLQGYGEFSGGSVCFAKLHKSPQLEALAQSVRENLTKRGVIIDTKPFSPHITLARQAVFLPQSDKRVIENALSRKGVEVREISLMKSERIQGKLTYTEIFKKVLE